MEFIAITIINRASVTAVSHVYGVILNPITPLCVRAWSLYQFTDSINF